MNARSLLLRTSLPLAIGLVLPSCDDAAEMQATCEGAKCDGLDESGRFVSSLDEIPTDYQGPIFRLKQDFPTAPVAVGAAEQAFLAIDFKTDPDAYLSAIRGYVYQGLGLDDPSWPGHFDGATGWYNTPWLHAGQRGREFVHGMTREVDAPAGKLAPEQMKTAQTWGIAYYNAIGGFTLGEVWRDPMAPRPESGQFSEGAVVAKFLFSTARDVPWLEGSFEWTGNINRAISVGSIRRLLPVRLLQIDIAVKDARAETGWVFATYVYDPAAAGASGWEKMAPVGLAYGNDPGVTPEDIASGAKSLTETRLSALIPEHARRTLGWGGRLNGPADNPNSSCMSCHMTSQWRPRSGMTSSANSPARMRWFRNLKDGEPFDDGQVSLDFSLQLQQGLVQFHRAMGADE